ncbi:carboxymuconolactone decarboxylase family protein [Streptomyces californicus]|uniref:carboxymuconolactone decarboxylase family protein n=1 Tax=Streptomyces californicus TaxID=67351 RepID=UPI00365D9634
MEEKQGAAGQAVGGITYERADLSDEVLFGDVWEREGLSPRDRSLVAVIALIALCLSERLGFHLVLAPDTAPD